ncbi:MAG: GAF domain-containing protein, partial [Aquabacterium sp.]
MRTMRWGAAEWAIEGWDSKFRAAPGKTGRRLCHPVAGASLRRLTYCRRAGGHGAPADEPWLTPCHRSWHAPCSAPCIPCPNWGVGTQGSERVTAAPVQPFIQIVEVWTPTADRCALELHGGLFGEHEAFKAISRKLYFGYGEGLPGRAWAERRPVIFTDLQQAGFVRRVAARRDALTCAVGLPIFAGDYLLAVLAFFCGADEQRVGAIE